MVFADHHECGEQIADRALTHPAVAVTDVERRHADVEPHSAALAAAGAFGVDDVRIGHELFPGEKLVHPS
jgi:hypothetical protein